MLLGGGRKLRPRESAPLVNMPVAGLFRHHLIVLASTTFSSLERKRKLNCSSSAIKICIASFRSLSTLWHFLSRLVLPVSFVNEYMTVRG
jgi:hypothetical protein